MAYRYDHDLEFLGKLSSDELNDLVYTLTHDKDGKNRLHQIRSTCVTTQTIQCIGKK